MTKPCLLLTSALLFLLSFAKGQSCPLGISGTRTIGPTGNYTTLQAALNDLHTKGLSGKVILELQPGYSSAAEIFPITARAIPCAAPAQGVTIRPAAGAGTITISSNDSNTTIDLNNTTYIMLDGRAAGTGSGAHLVINNTNVNGSAIRFVNGASHNQLRYLDLHGVTTYAGRGVISIAGSDSATGNCYNHIDTCNVSNGLTDPVNGIAAASPGNLKTNVGNAITGCNIFNFWGKWPNTGCGVSLSPGNDSASILGNSFYQTNNRDTTLPDYTGQYQIAAIYVDNSYTGPVNVSGNYIGGTAPLNGGAVLKIASCNSFYGIRVKSGGAGVTPPSTVNDNIISNLTLKDGNGTYVMIELSPFNGVCNNNTIGCLGGFNLLTATATQSSINFTGIDVATQGRDSSTISNNHIAGVSVTAPQYSWNIGIQVHGNYNGNSRCLVENNSIGDDAAGGNTVTGYGDLDGIMVSTQNDTYAHTPSHIVVRGNTVSGTGSTACRNRGIWAQGNVVGTVEITGNKIHRLSSGDGAFVTPSPVDLRGIYVEINDVTGSNGTLSCTDNKVYDLLANASQNDKMSGIYMENISGTGGIQLKTNVSRNLIKQILLSGTPGHYTGAQIAGMVVDMGTDSLTVDNNTVQLGYIESTNPPACPYIGIRHYSGPTTYLHNTILLQGNIGWADGRTDEILGTCFHRVDSSSCRLVNNIFAITRTYLPDTANPHFSLLELTSHKNFTADHNIYYGVKKALIGLNTSQYYGGYEYLTPGYSNYYSTLTDWQTATGWDKHSLSTDPLLADPDRDLRTPPQGVHLSNHTPAEAAGDSTATTLTDIDGELRAALTPVDIGADAGNFNGPPAPPSDTTHSDTTRADTTSRPRDSVSLATPAPNPFTGLFNVHVNAGQPGTADISVFYFSGNLLLDKKAQVVKGDNVIPVDMSAYPDGSYILKVELAGRKQTSVILKKTS
ncbi:MAG: T9SS type A sorting domain-containing protein [Bacteroidetes bacterium]|nr:T9SS type A sorting domain-containing protein [Bacteroidota bacterium]